MYLLKLKHEVLQKFKDLGGEAIGTQDQSAKV